MKSGEIGKRQRQELLIELVREGIYGSQEALSIELKKRAGLKERVPQATISRDLRDLGIAKNSEGNFTLGEKFEETLRDEEFTSFFRQVASGVVRDVQLMGVSVQEGYAQATAHEIKKMNWRGVIGTLYTDDVVLIAVDKRSSAPDQKGNDAKILFDHLNSILRK